MILEYSEKLLRMHDTRFRFIEWAAKIGTKTDCVVCICHIYLYLYLSIYLSIYLSLYIYKHFLKKISRNIENDCFLFYEYLIYTVYIVMVLSYIYIIYIRQNHDYFDPKYSNQLLQYHNTSLPHIPNFENIFDW